MIIDGVISLASYAVPSFVHNSKLNPLTSRAPTADIRTWPLEKDGTISRQAADHFFSTANARHHRFTGYPIPATIAPRAPPQLSLRVSMELLARLEKTPTMLPQHIAQIISATSNAARLSLRSSSAVADLFLDSLRYSTSSSISLTRRVLSSAVGSARCKSALDLGSRGFLKLDVTLEKGFMKMLDHYTNVGIYMVHNVFTLTELFAMAGFNLSQAAVTTSFDVCQFLPRSITFRYTSSG